MFTVIWRILKDDEEGSRQRSRKSLQCKGNKALEQITGNAEEFAETDMNVCLEIRQQQLTTLDQKNLFSQDFVI